MTITKTQLRSIITGTQEEKVESLCKLLDYPVVQKDPQGSRFWYLRPANDEDDAEDTCPIAVSFYSELNELTSDSEVKQFFSSEDQDKVIRGHYIQSTAENQPVMYLLFPSTDKGRIAFILPTESRLRRRSIQSFSYDDGDLLARLGRLQWAELADKVLEKAINLIPQVDWIFYKPAVTAKELAEELAIVTQRIEQVIPSVYHSEGEDGYLHKLLKSFQKELLPNLKLASDDEKEYSFADIYAQTIAYGLFTARVFSYVKNPKLDFYRQGAWDKLPETNPFLRQLFKDISERSPSELGDELIDCITEAFAVLRAAKMDAILADFLNKMNREDIVIRFYEDFLKAYKPRMREKRGVYYTPEPVVSYMVRSVDELIKDKFNKPLGIADPEVMILDPACGTGTFLLWIFQLIHQRYEENPEALTKGLSDKSWSGYVSECLLPRIFGFELLVAPYSICHLKLGLFLEETGYQFNSGKRLGVYLTNTLDNGVKKSEFLLEEYIAEESNKALEIKKDKPVMVIIGNPPYSKASHNKNDYIEGLMKAYKVNIRQEESQIQSISNDYIKFIRFAEWKIKKTGSGILAFITGHGYLNGTQPRDMRKSLKDSFNYIYTINLHGSVRRDIGVNKDEPVFAIQQGTAITLALKLNSDDRNIFYSEIKGTLEKKDNFLLFNSITTNKWQSVFPEYPYFFFNYQSDRDDNQFISEEYNLYPSLTEIFGTGNRQVDKEKFWATGFSSQQDEFAISFTPQEVKNKIIDILESVSEEELRQTYRLCTTNQWNYFKAKKEIKNLTISTQIKTCSYRPFDYRYTIFDKNIVSILRWNISSQFLLNKLNISLIITRAVNDASFNHVFVSQLPTDKIFLSSKTSTNAYVFPLYFYPTTNIEKEMGMQKITNFSQQFIDKIEVKLGYSPTPEAIFYYIYAVFHSPTYRSRYAEFLKIDFPRVPLTSNKQLFTELSALGEQLVQLHLMTSPKLDNLITKFIENGGNKEVKIDTAKKAWKDGIVKLNSKDYFIGISEEVWNFYIGGYQVCHKWLKDRKGRTLSDDDILHYQKIVIALSETIKLMTLIDETIPNFPIE